MKMRRDFYNSGFTCAVVWQSLACLLFILSLATMITAKPTINEIDMTSNATNETYPPIMCPGIMACRWGFRHKIDEVTGCQTCWDPCSNVECPENKTCVLQMRCFTTPCPALTTCENITLIF